MEKTQETNRTNDTVERQSDALSDLPVGGEQAEDAKGGAGSSGIMAQFSDGSVR